MQVIFQNECWTQSFYTRPFYVSSPKIQTVLDVSADTGRSVKLHAQGYDEASGLFHTLWAEATDDNATRSIIFTDQLIVFPPANTFKVYTTPLMRWYVELTGSGTITMRMAVFDLNSQRQAA